MVITAWISAWITKAVSDSSYDCWSEINAQNPGDSRLTILNLCAHKILEYWRVSGVNLIYNLTIYLQSHC